MTNGEKKVLTRGLAAGTILGLAVGLIIALFIALVSAAISRLCGPLIPLSVQRILWRGR